MSGVKWAATISEVALSAATAKTVLQVVAATNQRLLVNRFGVFFDGISTTAEPVQVRILRQTTAGTSSANTPVKRVNSDSETLQVTARDTFTVEPTNSDVYDVFEVHPQQGIDVILPFGQEIVVKGGDRLGIECTAPAAVNCRAKFWGEE